MISPSPTAAFRPLEEGGVVLDIETGDYYEVNRTGRFIWEALGAGAERQELISTLAEEFSIQHEQATNDVDSFIEALQDRSLISISD